jgi:uncharacterized membrane protein required for colicin V production
MNSFDLLLVVIFALGGLIGWHVGIFRAFTSLASYVIAGIFVAWWSPVVAQFIAKSTQLDESISSWLSHKTGLAKLEAQYLMWLEQPQVKASFASSELGDIGVVIRSQSSIADAAAQYIVLGLTAIIMFIILKIVFKFIFKKMDAVMKRIPFIEKINAIGGMVLGLLTALFVSTLVTLLWVPISYATNWGNRASIHPEGSWIANHLLDWFQLNDSLILDAASTWVLPLFLGK